MEEEASSFESSEMLANILASTPLLSESWKVCSHANSGSSLGFVANQVGDVTYLGFSGFGAVAVMDPSLRNLVPLETGDGIFSGLQSCRRDDSENEPVMVHAGFLNLFLAVYRSPNFQNQILEIMNKNESVVFTGHSIGGTIASLSALWLLSSLKTLSTSLSILCITFGSPLLGNKPLSNSILHNRWGGNFCHVIAKYDIVPRLLFAPLTPLGPHLRTLLQYWHLSITSPYLKDLAVPLPDREKSELFHFVLAHIGEMTKEDRVACSGSLGFWPFGNFVFTSEEGAVCLDNSLAIVKLLHLMLTMGCPSSCVEDHLKYGEYVGEVSMQFLKRKSGFMEEELPQSSYDAGVALALQSSGISSQEAVSDPAKDCLKMAKRMGRAPNLNSANLAIGLSKINPLRAQIEWYKASCDESEDQMGYYDSFKQRGASRKGNKVNMNRLKLAMFWDEVIHMLETEKLPHDFHTRAKWVNTSQFYKLLVEPLDIAEYYRNGFHRIKGHYIAHGRERRYEIFDSWWRERRVGEEENKKRSKFASLTQDTCFWARVEEAREWLESVRSEGDPRKRFVLWENIGKFEEYARRMIERKEVSKDVILKNSSYSLWVEELEELKLQLQKFPQVPGLLNGEVVP